MSEHKKLARLAARAFYRHSSTKARLARTGNAKHDNSAIAEVLIDALTRRTWVKEEELARAVLLSAKQVRKALLYLEEQRLVTRSHVKEKDKERHERTRLRAEENGVDEGIILERLRNIEKKTVTYVCLNYSRVVDALTLRIYTARRDLKHKAEKGPVSVLFKCTADPELCDKRYSSLDAARLMDPVAGAFVCPVCRSPVVQLGGGEDGAAAEPRTREGLRKQLETFEAQIAPVARQLEKCRSVVPPQYGSLNEFARARRRAAERLAGEAGLDDAQRAARGGGFGGGADGLGIQHEALEDTKFEITLGLTEEQEAAMEAELHAPKAQPEWITRDQFAKENAALEGETTATENDEAGEGGAKAVSGVVSAEEKLKEEWLRAYLGALKQAPAEAAPAEEAAGGDGADAADAADALAGAASTDDLVAEAMAADGGEEDEWEDVEDDDWEDA
jgi:transcription initiation factor TFIIE subunit alpha